jgi:anaerobic selenocysteine-containing dehydrogenase
VVNMNLLGRTLLEENAPPIKALFVYNANPVATVPDQHRIIEGMKREDLFTVVFEQVMTDTAPYADILLPATTFLEHTELSTSYGAYGVTLSGPVIPAEGEARSNEAVFTAIGDALGIAGSWPRGEAQIAMALEAIGGPLAVKDPAERLRIVRGGGRLTFDFPGERPVQFKTAFPRTADGKVHLWPAELGDDPYVFLPDPGDAQHPLALISPATGKTISSSLAEYGFTEAFLEIHPDDAAARRLADGDTARVHNALGEVIVRVRLSATIRPGVASLPKGIWNRHTKNGVVGNALVPDAISRVSGGACFNDARVEVARV